MSKRVVFIDGARTPFLKSGTDYMDLMSYQLGAFAIKGVLDKTGIHPDQIDQVVMGTVVHNVKTPNVAREAALTAGLNMSTPCQTVSQACISANQAISRAADMIRLGQADVIIAGGTDNTSDSPIGYKKSMRKKLFNAQKLKTTGDMIKFALSLKISDFFPDKPAVAEFLTDRLMGEDCDMLAAKFNIKREDQDAFALRSHTLAQKAQDEGILAKEIVSVELPPKFTPINKDNGIRVAPIEKLAKLGPAFVKPHGTLTAANSSFLTDGAAAVLIMSEEKAKELGFTPKAYINDYIFTAQDIHDELLLGPAYAMGKILQRNNLTMEDIDVIEFHEAFAGQILANIAALASEDFCKNHIGLDKAVGQIPMDKMNLWGGSLSIGHPFGATGARIMTTTANRLIAEGGKYGLLAACAAGAHGHACILERYES